MKLYVGNLSYNTTQETLSSEFGGHGEVEEVAVITDRETGRPHMVRTAIADKLTALTAAQAMTAALLARERTGEGQHVRCLTLYFFNDLLES